MQFKVDNVLGRASGFNHIPSWRLVARFGSITEPGTANGGNSAVSVCVVSLQRVWSWVGRVNI